MAAEQQQVQTPDAALDALKMDLDEKKQTASTTAREIAELNESISSLEPITKEIKQILTSYNQALKNLKCDRDDLQNYLSSKGEKIKDEITTEGKKDVVDKRKEFDDWISATEDEWENKHKDAYTKYLEAKAVFEEKQKSYNDLKNYQKDTENKIKEVKTLREGAEKEYSQHHIAKAYFLVYELEIELGEIDLKTPEEFEHELYEAALQLHEAKEDLRVKTKTWEAVDKEFKEKQKELELRKKNRREEILKKIGDVSAASAASGKA